MENEINAIKTQIAELKVEQEELEIEIKLGIDLRLQQVESWVNLNINNSKVLQEIGKEIIKYFKDTSGNEVDAINLLCDNIEKAIKKLDVDSKFNVIMGTGDPKRDFELLGIKLKDVEKDDDSEIKICPECHAYYKGTHTSIECAYHTGKDSEKLITGLKDDTDYKIISKTNLFFKFMKRMKEKFDKEDEKHGDSWKTVEIYKLRCFLKQHADKWLDNHNCEIRIKQEISDLIDIANYCMMLFHRLKEIKKK